jgi:hypothetical protein
MLIFALALQIEWRTDYASALKEAKESGKLVCVSFYMPT